MRRFRSNYGATPLHLVLLLASFVIAGWAVSHVTSTGPTLNFVLWFAGAIVVHDLVLLPLYSLLAGAGYRLLRVEGAGRQMLGEPTALPIRTLAHLLVPTAISAIVFVVWFPLILGLSESRYRADTGLSTSGYLGRWLLLTAALFLISAVAYAVRLRRARAG